MEANKILKNTMVTCAMKYYAETKASYTRDSLGKPQTQCWVKDSTKKSAYDMIQFIRGFLKDGTKQW